MKVKVGDKLTLVEMDSLKGTFDCEHITPFFFHSHPSTDKISLSALCPRLPLSGWTSPHNWWEFISAKQFQPQIASICRDLHPHRWF